MEADFHGGGFDARGVTFPGISLYVPLGRGRDFSWSATTATNDNVDQFVEVLASPTPAGPRASPRTTCKGRCILGYSASTCCGSTRSRPTPERRAVFAAHDHAAPAAQRPRPDPGNGDRQGRAGGDRPGPLHVPARGRVGAGLRAPEHEPGPQRHDRRVSGQINFVFNWFYNDSRDVAYITRDGSRDAPAAPTPTCRRGGRGRSTGRASTPGRSCSQRIAQSRQPQATNPPLGFIANWNNKQAPGWRAADDMFAYGSVHRSERLSDRVRAALRGGRKLDLPGLVGIMGDAATVDLRGQEAWPILRRVIGSTGDADAKAGVAILDAWAAKGAHRRDRDGDNVYEDSAAVALMDAWWNPMVRAVFDPVLGTRLTDAIREQLAFDQPAGPAAAPTSAAGGAT